MTVIQISTFRLGVDADEAEFLAADQRFQTDVVYQQEGLLRRTTARRGDTWVVIELWASDEHAASASQVASLTAETMATLVDAASIETHRYTPVD